MTDTPTSARCKDRPDARREIRENVLARLPRTELDGEPRYLHPNGYVIERGTRGREHGRTGHNAAGSMHWWDIYEHIARRRSSLLSGRVHPWARKGYNCTGSKDTLREARAWCDEHPREGWA